METIKILFKKHNTWMPKIPLILTHKLLLTPLSNGMRIGRNFESLDNFDHGCLFGCFYEDDFFVECLANVCNEDIGFEIVDTDA